MVFGLDHWSMPRAKIGFDLTDAQYFFEGMANAVSVMKALALPFEKMAASSILDFGCGTGRTSRPLSLFFRRVVGYDPQADCIAAAKSECPPFGLCRETKFKNLAYMSEAPDESFDFACSIGVFEHLKEEDCEKALRLLHSLMKNESWAVLRVPAFGSPAVERILGCSEKFEKGKTPRTVQRLFRKEDFRL